MADQGPPPPPGYGYGQPVYGGQPMGQPPANNLVWAILTTVLCCLPFGIASIVFAAQVNTKWASGDVPGAHESAAKAKKWAMVAAVASVVGAVLLILGGVVGGVTSDGTTGCGGCP